LSSSVSRSLTPAFAELLAGETRFSAAHGRSSARDSATLRAGLAVASGWAAAAARARRFSRQSVSIRPACGDLIRRSCRAEAADGEDDDDDDGGGGAEEDKEAPKPGPLGRLRDRVERYADRWIGVVAPKLAPKPVRTGLALFGVLVSLAWWAVFFSKDAAAPPAFDNGMPHNFRTGLLWLMTMAQTGVEPTGVSVASKGRDLLVLLSSTAIGLPLIQKLGVASKVLGFLAIGIVIGPSGFALISDIHWSETLAEAGIIFFLCEMGLELSFDRLKNMRRDVFGLGFAQFIFTSAVIFLFARVLLGFNEVQALILGTALSLSSSAFALQLLDESKERGTMHGRSAFGILLFQDLAVPFLLVLLPMLSAGSTTSVFSAMKNAGVNALLALSPLFLGGRYLLAKSFSFVAESGNTVALRALSFFTVLGMCYMFQIFSLSNTLGAFLAGVILSETAYREQVNAAISPIREDLLGLFFITVGFGIDLSLVLTRPLLVLSAVSGLLLCKAVVTMGVCRVSGMSFANSQHVGLLLCQAGEFSFVMFKIADEVGAFTAQQAKLLLTVVSVSMACTPLLSRLGRELSACLQENQGKGQSQLTTRKSDLCEKVENARVLVCGYGRVGTLVTELLDTKFIPWVAFDVDPEIVAQARAKDLPVFLGDLPELASRAMDGRDRTLLDAKRVAVVTPADTYASIEMVKTLRQSYPQLTIVARALSRTAARSIKDLGAEPIVPGLPEDTILMNLPIGISVLRAMNVSQEDAESVVEKIRKSYLKDENQKVLPKSGEKGALVNLIRWYQGEQQRSAERDLEMLAAAEDTATRAAAAAALAVAEEEEEEQREEEEEQEEEDGGNAKAPTDAGAGGGAAEATSAAALI